MRVIAILLTVLTGFSGLVYEVTWQKYLAILLGSHSESTAAVLGIVLFGLSAGYTLFGALARRLVARGRARGAPPRLLVVYGGVEAAIGAYALAFPLLFQAAQALSLELHHGVSGWGFAVDVALTALLLLPPTALMGGTIPILTQALAWNLSDATRFHALVYGFNTAGAFAGALAAGLILIPELGLVKVLFAMGVLNLAGVAILLSLLYTRLDEAPYWVYRLRILFPSDDASLYPFHLSGFAAILALIGVPVALSGATFPLIFHQLRRGAAELGAVAGSVYSWNTIGSLLGAVGGCWRCSSESISTTSSSRPSLRCGWRSGSRR